MFRKKRMSATRPGNESPPLLPPMSASVYYPGSSAAPSYQTDHNYQTAVSHYSSIPLEYQTPQQYSSGKTETLEASTQSPVRAVVLNVKKPAPEPVVKDYDKEVYSVGYPQRPKSHKVVKYRECWYDGSGTEGAEYTGLHIERQGDNVQFYFGLSHVFHREIIHLQCDSEGMLFSNFGRVFDEWEAVINQLRVVIDGVGAQILIEQASSPVHILRVLSKVTEAADQLERDCIVLKWSINNMRDPEAPEWARRVDNLKQTVSTDLVKKVDSLFQRASNIISIDEVYKSREQSATMSRLTWVTFIFLPLIFVSGLFGMNIQSLGDPGPPWYTALYFAIPVAVFTALLYIVLKYPPSKGWVRAIIFWRVDAGAALFDAEVGEHYRLQDFEESFKRACYDGSYCTVLNLLQSERKSFSRRPDILGKGLVEATLKRHKALVRLLLSQSGINVNETGGWYGCTAFAAAVASGDMDLVRVILQYKSVDINCLDQWGCTPLMTAIDNGDFAMTEFLLQEVHVNPNIQSPAGRGWIALHSAVERDSWDIVKLLVTTKEVYMNGKDTVYGWTPLHYAARRGKVDFIELLLCRREILVNEKDNEGRTPLHLAAEHSQAAVVKLLITDLESAVDVNATSKDGSTVLHFAAKSSNPRATVDTLLRCRRINVNEKDVSGLTPLHTAASIGAGAVMDALLKDKRVIVNTRDYDGCTPLHTAAINGHENVIEILLKADHIDVNAKNFEQQTPLHVASKHGRREVVDTLLKAKGVLVNPLDCNGRTPLHLSVELGSRWGWTEGEKRQMETMRLLLDTKKVDVNCRDNFGETPLHLAVRSNFLNAVKDLLENNLHAKKTTQRTIHPREERLFGSMIVPYSDPVDDYAESSNGSPAPGKAPDYSSRNIINLNAQSMMGRTPLSLATSSEMIRLLEEYGAE